MFHHPEALQTLSWDFGTFQTLSSCGMRLTVVPPQIRSMVVPSPTFEPPNLEHSLPNSEARSAEARIKARAKVS